MKVHFLLALLIFAIILIVAGIASFFPRGRQEGGVDRYAYADGIAVIAGRTFRLEVARTLSKRAKGLSGQEYIGGDEGMLFVFSTEGDNGFWMKDMKFPIDIVWIKGDRIAGFSENLPPPQERTSIMNLKSYYPPEPVDKVLELKAGAVQRYGIKEGDQVTLRFEGEGVE